MHLTGKFVSGKCVLSRGELLVLFGGLVALVALIFLNNKAPFYDEDDYLRNVPLLEKFGFGKTYLLHHVGSAGPLYAFVHTLFEPFTKLQTPHIRLVNIAFLVAGIYSTALTLNLLKFPGCLALLVMSIPMTYVTGGLALTEMPAICFISAGIYLVLKAVSGSSSSLSSFVKVSLGGLLLGFAIVGRQPYLLVLGALPLLIINLKNTRYSASLLLVALISSLALPCYTFYTWKGLVAPLDTEFYEQLVQQGVSYSPEYFLVCLAYYAIIFIIVTPAFFPKPSKTEVAIFAALFTVASLINYQYAVFTGLPLGYITTKAFGGAFLEITEVLSGAGLLALGSYFLFTLVRQLHKNNYPKNMLFFAVAITGIAFSCIKMTGGFSSRYAAQAIPFIIPLCAYFYRESYLNIYRMLLGVVLGLASYASYVFSG